MVKSILLPIDGSERSREALDFAVETFPESEITAYHVVTGGSGDLGAFAGMTGDLPDEEAIMESSKEILKSARRRGDEHGIPVETARGRGRPDKLILDQAETGDYDLVIIGSHGRDGLARVLLGSVAEKVVRRSPIPVLVYRPGDSHFEGR